MTIQIQCCGSGSGIRCFFDPGIRDGLKSASGSGILGEQTGSYFLELRHQFFDADPGSWMEINGSGIKIPDPPHWV